MTVVLSPDVTPYFYANLIIMPILPEKTFIKVMAQRLKENIYQIEICIRSIN
jgi:hypothetical protein